MFESEVKVFEIEPGRYCLSFIDTNETTAQVFREHSLQGGGYTWEGVLASLIKMRMPADSPSRQLEIEAEADNLCIHSADVRLLEQVKQLLDEAASDPQLLVAAILNAGTSLE